MPFIRTTTNLPLTHENEIRVKHRLEQIVSDILGKNPERMLTAFEGNLHLYRGTDDRGAIPAAFIECKFFGGRDYADFEKFDEQLKIIYGEELGISPQNLYVKYEVINGWDQQAQIFKI
jgi:hypothetical protein